jgi:hypothetical protein
MAGHLQIENDAAVLSETVRDEIERLVTILGDVHFQFAPIASNCQCPPKGEVIVGNENVVLMGHLLGTEFAGNVPPQNSGRNRIILLLSLR